MGKNKHKHRHNTFTTTTPHSSQPVVAIVASNNSPSPTTTAEAAARIAAISTAANNQVTEDDLNNPPTPSIPPSTSDINLIEIWRVAHEAKELFERAKTRADNAEFRATERESAAQTLISKLDEREEKLTAQYEEQRKIQRELDERKLALDRRERETVQTEEKLKEREIAAEAGFLQQRRQAVAKLDEEAKALAQQISEHHHNYLEEVKKYEREIQLIRERELVGIDEMKQQLQSEKARAEKSNREAEWAKQDADELKTSWIGRIEERVREAVADRESRLQSALGRCEALAKEISRYEELERVATGKTREQLLSELAAARERITSLTSELAAKPADEQVAYLRNLESESETLHSDLARLWQENQSLQVQLGKLTVGVTELQNLRDQKLVWESRERALRSCVDDLRNELGELVDKSKAQRVFPSLTAMDENPEFQTPPERTRDKILSLKSLVEEIQQRIGAKRLFYRVEDIRAFLGGLASSRLHLLQGISGTGKTSLPRTFAESIGATSSVIEVQSGWRDRNDLLGYYNAFEKRFYESEFLQALYRAQQPLYKGLPYFIVLDEMNLSHPEHYFADFLSALEQGKDDQRVTLLTAKVDGAPQLLEDSRRIRIPANVWFIGTANHDETTKDFADKTYDRSHVMEFPRHPKAFAVTLQNSPVPVSMGAIEAAFAKARENHRDESGRAKAFLDRALAEMLGKLGIGWGNRLERQMESFIPVLISAGGSLGEATDHLIASKLLRKIRGRFDIGATQLKEFHEHLLKTWASLEKDHLPEKCSELLDRETKRLSGGTN